MNARVRFSLAAFFVLALASPKARAGDPLNSSCESTPPETEEDKKAEKEEEKKLKKEEKAEKEKEKKDEEKNGKFQLNVVPIVGGSTDIGVGGGAFFGLARVKKGHEPYLWNFESVATVMFREHDDKLQSPYQDVYFKLTVPQFLGLPMRVEVRPSYTWERTLGYYGVGNASVAQGPTSAGFDQYGRIRGAMDTLMRLRVVDHIALQAGIRYTQSSLQVDPNTKLSQDLASTDPEIHSLVHGPTSVHGVALFQYGVQWDNRDNETSTHAGSYDEASIKLSPGGTEAFPYRYGQTNFTGTVFIPIKKPQVTLAMRFVFDAMFGDPPFYELSRFADTYAIGGSSGVRGVPGQRYSGKIKAFGNIELRTELAKFRMLKKPFIFGAVGFFDGGRVWADWKPEPQLDGTGLGLKYGTGAGLRLMSGQAFVLRLDVAWSPDASPVGAYFGAGQMF